MLPQPKGVRELFFDGDPARPTCVSIADRAFPKTESVLAYMPDARNPVVARITAT